MTPEKGEIMIAGNYISLKGLTIIGMSIFLYYLIIVGCTLINLPRWLP